MQGANGFRSQICGEFSNSQWISRKLINIAARPRIMSLAPTERGVVTLENSTRSLTPTEAGTQKSTKKRFLLQVRFGLEVWGEDYYTHYFIVYYIYYSFSVNYFNYFNNFTTISIISNEYYTYYSKWGTITSIILY
jgi:hypothetical protein